MELWHQTIGINLQLQQPPLFWEDLPQYLGTWLQVKNLFFYWPSFVHMGIAMFKQERVFPKLAQSWKLSKISLYALA